MVQGSRRWMGSRTWSGIRWRWGKGIITCWGQIRIEAEVVDYLTLYSTLLVVWTHCSIPIGLRVSKDITANPPTILMRSVNSVSYSPSQTENSLRLIHYSAPKTWNCMKSARWNTTVPRDNSKEPTPREPTSLRYSLQSGIVATMSWHLVISEPSP